MMEKSTPARHECPIANQFAENHVLAQTRLPHRRPLPPSRLTTCHASRNARTGRHVVVHHLYQTFYRFDFGRVRPQHLEAPRRFPRRPGPPIPTRLPRPGTSTLALYVLASAFTKGGASGSGMDGACPVLPLWVSDFGFEAGFGLLSMRRL